ncbi:carboxymuconolactone decarboxylase family protein [Thiofilum flexile]|uniref:carboxymuconolactone decarboxylase family protein n=1 Tax=Thiofilum flexile TaxID=125627 RepID=UPI00035C0E02|nr:carboxymuconolactone decarboxylase family protein [Thiofilum flexile]
MGKPITVPVSEPLYDFAPDINVLLQSHLFGDLFGRGILDYKNRELVTISALASVAGLEPQLRSYLNVGLNTGLTKKQLAELGSVIGQVVGKPEATKVEQLLQAIQ